jgi:hypothetical protein
MAGLLLLACLQAPTLDADAGFRGGTFMDSWSQVSAFLSYDGSPIECELRITLHSPAAERVVYQRSLPLFGKLRKRISTDVFLTGHETSAEVELFEKGRLLQQVTVPLLIDHSSNHRILAVEPMALSLRDGFYPAAPVTIVTTPAELLPGSVLPLRCLDTIVFPEPVELSLSQEEALRHWVDEGGRLILFAGRSTLGRQHPLWKEWCPLRDPTFSAVPLSADPADGNLTLLRGSSSKGRSLVWLGDAPLMIRDTLGAGELLYMTFMADDPKALRFFADKGFLAGLLDLPPPPPPRSVLLRRPRPVPGKVADHPPQRIAHPSDRFLDVLLPGGVLLRTREWTFAVVPGLLYILAIGPFEFVRLKRRGRLRNGWQSFILLAGMFTILFLWLGRSLLPGSPERVDLQFWDETGVQSFSELRAPGGEELEVRARGPISPQPPFLAFGSGESSTPPTVDSSTTLHLPLPPLAIRTLVSWRPTDSGERLPTATWLEGSARKVTLVNPGSRPLTDCWIVSRERAWPVGDLPAGASRTTILGEGREIPAWKNMLLGAEKPPNVGDFWWENRIDRYGLVVEFFEALHAHPDFPADRDFLFMRGLDCTTLLSRGEMIFTGAFRKDHSAISLSPPIPTVVHGWFRARVRRSER